MGGLLAAWAGEMGLLAYRDVKDGHTIAGLPLPADFLWMTGVFALLGMVPKSNAGASRAATWGGFAIVLATAMNINPLTKTTSTSPAKSPTPPPKAVPIGGGVYQSP